MIQGTTPSPEKIYPGSADEDYLKVFNMSLNDTSMYGSYSVTRPVSMEGVSASNEILPDVVISTTTLDNIATNVDETIVVKMADYINTGVDMLDGGSF